MTSARFGALWIVAVSLISGVALIGVSHVRLGGFVVAGAITAAAVFRLMLPLDRAGGLVVRSRLTDVTFLLVMAVALLVIVATLDL